MVMAILDGRKTQTRRLVKPQPSDEWAPVVGADHLIVIDRHGDEQPGREVFGASDEREGRVCPYGRPGDRLWVRETYYAWGHWTKRFNQKKRREEWHFVDETVGAGLSYRYEADEKLPRRKRELHEVAWWKRPAIFMPRAASRITLEITEVRVERLQSISEADALAEGVEALPMETRRGTPRADFCALWESINGAGSWDANPWLWCVSFRPLAPTT